MDGSSSSDFSDDQLSVGSDAGISLNETKLSETNPLPSYEILDSYELISLMNKTIADVAKIINLPNTLLRLLLTHYHWDKDAFTEAYFEIGLQRIFKLAKVNRENFSLTNNASALSHMSCLASECFLRHYNRAFLVTDATSSQLKTQLVGLGCTHYFCENCWSIYLKHKILDENHVDRIPCLAINCDFIVDDSVVIEFVASDVRLRLRFQKLITNSFVCSNKSLIWCPGKDCTKAAKLHSFETQLITCTSCSERFCSSCGNPWHDPAPCRQFKLWLQRISQDSGTSNWIVAHTKECPKCKVVIEKAGGCNHMICFNQHCKYEFCWVCLDKWEPHSTDWYNCNRYEQAKQERQSDSRAELLRYLFYLRRYMNHAQSLKFESRLYIMMQERVCELLNEGSSYLDLKFLNEIVDKLCRCRRTLMYTYVFAYYVTTTNESEIFESNQRDLEMATESLSGLLERDLNTTPIESLKLSLLDKASYCDKRRQVLLEHVHEGSDHCRWDYREN
ncbi:hypothetical protein Ciccas_004344 [Cichlidogyrus casuarinus]|uniref:RBR-type E3 ubiquitin transferase n=1 Tax=Cichlidogyrus casuarinus TaxID=1844966 RepID=A0ABD2QCM4_9PLAT